MTALNEWSAGYLAALTMNRQARPAHNLTLMTQAGLSQLLEQVFSPFRYPFISS